jgi:hypothetical protein
MHIILALLLLVFVIAASNARHSKKIYNRGHHVLADAAPTITIVNQTPWSFKITSVTPAIQNSDTSSLLNKVVNPQISSALEGTLSTQLSSFAMTVTFTGSTGEKTLTWKLATVSATTTGDIGLTSRDFQVRRAQSGTSTYYFVTTQIVPAAWMHFILDDVQISDLVIPGTHDSAARKPDSGDFSVPPGVSVKDVITAMGTEVIGQLKTYCPVATPIIPIIENVIDTRITPSSNALIGAIDNWLNDQLDNLVLDVLREISGLGAMQTKTITQQLNMGIRFFDLRINHINGQFVSFHGPLYLFNWMDRIIADMVTFLKANPHEGIIVSLQKEGGPDEDAFWTHVQTALITNANDTILWNPSGIPKLKDIRKKIVFLNSGSFGISYNNMCFQNDYSGVGSFDEKVTDIATQFNYMADLSLIAQCPSGDHFQHGDNTSINKYWFVNMFSSFDTSDTSSMDDGMSFSTKMNSKQLDVLSTEMRPMRGIIAMDNPTQDLTNLLISMNHRYTDPSAVFNVLTNC